MCVSGTTGKEAARVSSTTAQTLTQTLVGTSGKTEVAKSAVAVTNSNCVMNTVLRKIVKKKEKKEKKLLV